MMLSMRTRTCATMLGRAWSWSWSCRGGGSGGGVRRGVASASGTRVSRKERRRARVSEHRARSVAQVQAEQLEQVAQKYETIVGLEVHAQVSAQSKLFSSGAVRFLAAANSVASLVDVAMPGTLPVLNGACVDQAVRTGLALRGDVQERSLFDRKHYFYCDLPQGYQITQQGHPIVRGGSVVLDDVLEDGDSCTVRIDRVQLEQDSGKNVHDFHPSRTYVDLNRAGVALMEIVTMPDMRSPEHAVAFVKQLQALLRHIRTSPANMQDGSLRCDVNVNVRRRDDPSVASERVEIKNLNSLRFIAQAIRHEVLRQSRLLDAGELVLRETRAFDGSAPDGGQTVRLRTKEQLLDYRFLPEPDLSPLVIDAAHIAELEQGMPELLTEIGVRFQQVYNLSKYDASVLLEEPDAPVYFENVLEYVLSCEAAEGPEPTTERVREVAKLAANWVSSELFGRLRDAQLAVQDSPVSPDELACVLRGVEAGHFSGKAGKSVVDLLFARAASERRHGEEAEAAVMSIIDEHGWRQISDPAVLNAWVDEVLHEHSDDVTKYIENGRRNKRVASFLVGKVIQKSNKRANPAAVRQLVDRALAQS